MSIKSICLWCHILKESRERKVLLNGMQTAVPNHLWLSVLYLQHHFLNPLTLRRQHTPYYGTSFNIYLSFFSSIFYSQLRKQLKVTSLYNHPHIFRVNGRLFSFAIYNFKIYHSFRNVCYILHVWKYCIRHWVKWWKSNMVSTAM